MTKTPGLADYKKYLKRLHLNRTLCGLILFTCLYTELFSYKLLSMVSWPAIPKSDNTNSVRMLLIADPQLQGYWNEPASVIGALTRSDVDHYISKTYHQALNYVKPDVIIFLGDLIDEGSVAGEQEYKEYVQRFYKIFEVKENHEKIHHIFIPGDNDIGGEGWDRVTPEKVERFEWAFHAPIEDEEIFKFITFDRVNIMPGAKSQLKHSQLQHRGQEFKQSLKILLSHIPLTDVRTPKGDETLKVFEPHLILSGHEHKSFFIRGGHQQPFENQRGFVNLNIRDKTIEKEIVVPTCNYRLGNAGFGAAVLQENGDMFYAVLWLPPRFKVLGLYVMLIPIFIGLVAIDKAFRKQSLINWCLEGTTGAVTKVGEVGQKVVKKSRSTKKDIEAVFSSRKQRGKENND